MKPAGRVTAAIEILDDMQQRHRPATSALADWGKAHRFAGSGDRAAIGNLVFDALRCRASSRHRLGAETARADVLGALATGWGMGGTDIAALADGSEHAPAALSEREQAALDQPLDAAAPAHVQAEVPEWLWPAFVRAFGDRAIAEGQALAGRAPVDLRVNTLKSTRDKVLKALEHTGAIATTLSPVGVRIKPSTGAGRQPNVEAETAHGKGWFEVQDEGSQLAAALSGAAPRQQVLDICAGAGGKALAMAATLRNSGQIYAYDGDKLRLRPIHERLKRAGARNVQVLNAGDEAALAALGARFDVVLVDAPCTGTGVWRRRPDAKWRLKPESIGERQAEQRVVLALAVPLVKPGGQLVYVTCSVLPEENGDQVDQLLAGHPEFTAVPTAMAWAAAGLGAEPPASADGRTDRLLLTPASHGTDGFFVAVLRRAG